MPNGNWQDGAWTGSGAQSFAVSDAVARNWRIKLSAEHAGPLAYVRLRPGVRLDNWESLAFTTLRNLVRAKPALRQDASAWVRRAEVRDLSGRTDAQGVFRGTLPAGRWTALRFADVNAGLKNGPAPAEATGWECDKLDPQGIEANFAGYIGRLVDGPLQGRLDGMLLDSWECARPNWTGKLERWFGERNGYPLRDWLPALAGFVIDDPAAIERFLLDWRTTVSTLIEENFFRRAVELGHSKGLAAPFTPFIAEEIYTNLKGASDPESVHLCDFPTANAAARDLPLERRMAEVMAVVELGRRLRADNDLKVRQPLATLRVAGMGGGASADDEELVALITDELNVKQVEFIADETELCNVTFKANFKTLGKKCGPKMKAVAAAIAALPSTTATDRLRLEIEGVSVEAEDVVVLRTPKAGLVVASSGAVVVGLETALTPELVAEGNAREFVSHVQAMRKEADFEVTQRIVVAVACDAEMKSALATHLDYVKNEILATEVTLAEGTGDTDLNGHQTSIRVAKA